MSFFVELKRRNVIRVGLAYVLLAWMLLQAADFALDLVEAPNWVVQVFSIAALIGLPVVLFFAWAFEITPEGIKREEDVDRTQSATRQTGRKLNILILVLLAVTASYFIWESRFKERTDEPVSQTASVAELEASKDNSATASPPSIAVLPFVNMSADPENEYFADGLAEEILNRLAQVPQLVVIGRTSSFAFKGENRDLREIGEILNVGNVLEGSVRRQGDEVRITAQLIASKDGAHLWSQTYDRELADVFEVQDEISQRVVDALDIILDEAQRQQMLNAGVRNVEAFVAYQKGSKLMIEAHGGPDRIAMLTEANAYYEQAATLAPPFAAAIANSADLYSHLVLDPGHTLETRTEALQRVLEIREAAFDAARDPTRKAMIALDGIFFTDDWSSLPRLLDEALSAPGNASSNWMELVNDFADIDGQIAYYERRLVSDPMMLLTPLILSDFYFQKGQVDSAEAVLEAAQVIDSNHRWVLSGINDLMLAKGDYAGARDLIERNETFGLLSELRLLALEGRMDEAQTLYGVWLSEVEREPRQLIHLLTWLGDREGANQAAAELDAQPAGPVELIRVINRCACGVPFDLEYTPNFAARIKEAGFTWPPATKLVFPAKDW